MTVEGVPPQLLAPLEFAPIEDSVRFAASSPGTVTAVPVTVNGISAGWLWWNDADHAAGWVTDSREGDAPIGVVFTWTDVWQSVAQAGHAPSAIASLVGEIDPNAGVPHWPSAGPTTLAALWEASGRHRSPLPAVAPLAAEALTGDRVSGPTLDAALRGQLPMSDAMVRQVDALDSALAIQPVPRDLVVARGTSLATWPGEPEELRGETFVEYAYLPVSLSAIEADVGDPVDAVVNFTVPAGVPALYTAPTGDAVVGVLVLARGLTYNVTHVERTETGYWVISAVIEWDDAEA